MIASLHGEIVEIGANYAIIEVSGVGYSVKMSTKDLAQLHTGQSARILTTLNVSQDSLSLFGFLHKSSQELFSQLQKASGIGPKVAMGILSTLSPDELAQAIHDNDVSVLTRTPGLGKKGAQKIIVELHGSLDISALVHDEIPHTSHESDSDLSQDVYAQQVIDGLMSLGWQNKDATNAVNLSLQDLELTSGLDAHSVPIVLRHALNRLDRGR